MKRTIILLLCILGISLGGQSQTSEKVYNSNELTTQPKFASGKMSMGDFLRFYQKYPESATKEGVVSINATINSNGEIKNPLIVKGLEPVIDNEALRLANLMPDYSPGMINNTKVSSTITIHIPFLISGSTQTASSNGTSAAQAQPRTKNPLYVIDGKIVNEDINVNADNIESVRVMKGKQAIERYGERAADGVIIFKTKNITSR